MAFSWLPVYKACAFDMAIFGSEWGEKEILPTTASLGSSSALVPPPCAFPLHSPSRMKEADP